MNTGQAQLGQAVIIILIQVINRIYRDHFLKFSLKWYKICYCMTRIRETYLIQRLRFS